MTNSVFVRGILVFALMVVSMGAVYAGDPIKGRELYLKHCSDCHGATGVPQVPEIPNFTLGQGLNKSDRDLLLYMKKGSTVMPAYEGILTDREILDVISHLRTFF